MLALMREINFIYALAFLALALFACSAESSQGTIGTVVSPEATISTASTPIVEPISVGEVLGSQSSKSQSVIATSTLIPPTIGPTPTRIVSPPTVNPGIPGTTASAVTFPPTNLEGLNSQTHVYGTGADPNVITLGPKQGGRPDWTPYPGKNSMEFELPRGTPILAPIDMEFVGFNNRNAIFRIGPNGERFEPFDDLELCFESTDSDWPGLVICTYHLMSSPLLIGQDINPECTRVDEWPGGVPQAQGHLWSDNSDGVAPETSSSRVCQPLIGLSVGRGQVIGYAGNVGEHSMAPFRFKVPDESENSLVKRGDRNLHWVQPGSFFYWKCFAPDADFSEGILAYPFECEGYELSLEKRDTGFKYSSVH